MKLASIKRSGGRSTVGAMVPGGFVDLGGLLPSLPHDMMDIIEAGKALLAEIEQAVPRGKAEALDSARLLAPVPRPPEFLGVGLNYRNHVDEATLALPSTPTIFNKQTSCIIGPYDEVVLPRASDQLDYEGELGIVIGSAARNMTRQQAAGAIFGYVVVNDLSVRDWQFSSPTVTIGKSFDTHGPFGPWIVTADEVADPQNLVLTTTINGEVRQRANTSDMIFGCVEIISFLSRVMTLRPGTIVTTGTPAGVGHFHNPPAYLRVGDLVAVDISGIGQISNRVIGEA